MKNNKIIKGFNLFNVKSSYYIGGCRYLKIPAGSKFKGYSILMKKEYITFSNYQTSELCFDYASTVELVKLSKDRFLLNKVLDKITVPTNELIEELKKVVEKEELGKNRITYFYEQAEI